ncbi:MAG: radical SAM protein [Anaerolineales bacterium]|nr:radical SAM protein [Anaerolineales bacterium]
MKLTSLHLLLTYQCNFECDHCFVWGSPWQSGVMTLADIREVLAQAKEHPSIRSIYFEGGEPFLYYPILLAGVEEALRAGFSTGIVSNAYWATSVEDAQEWLRPFVGKISDLSVSSDLFHYDEKLSQQAMNAQQAANELGIPLGMISIAQPDLPEAEAAIGQLPVGESGVMFRGRAAQTLVERASLSPWDSFVECPYENLRDPGRVHLDPLGHLHICQGISMGNLFEKPINTLCEEYDPDTHPIVAPLLEGGPAELIRMYSLPHEESYADACHLCYTARKTLRPQFAEIIAPDQMFGVPES